MPILHIQDIFSQFKFYQAQYLDIVRDPALYYQPVEDAHIPFSIVSEEKIYLGDLLQLWFGDKWTEHQVKVLNDVNHGLWTQLSECWYNSLFLFAIERKGLFAKTSALAWSTEEQQIKEITLDQTLPYYCHYLSLERPKRYS
ncbi:MAG: hypothetical protein VX136_09290 [Pseudomonadota bacterium]|nr:hypothetical protein [Pseudomonadota bacterium]